MNTINFKIPTTWNELNTYQIEKSLLILHQSKKITPISKFDLLTLLFVDEDPANETYSVIQKIKNFTELLKQVAIEDYYHYTDFLTQSNTLTVFPISFKITHKREQKEFFGPADRLINLTILEFATVDKMFYRWVTKQDLLDLDRICTILYRESAPGNLEDVREKFTMSRLSNRAKFIQQLPLATKLHIGYAFMASREALVNKFPVVFPKQKFKNITPPPTPKVYKGLTQMITSLATGETLPLGPLDSVEQTNVFKFFNIVSEMIIKAEKRKEQQKK